MLGLIMAVSCLLLPLSAQPTDIVQGVDSAAPDSPGSPESPGISPAGEDRDAKFLSVFQIVKFKNGACPASDGNMGTCFTEAECSSKGGTASGSCASGFGVCCIFSVTECGGTVTEDNTYITSPGYPAPAPAGMCMVSINKCDANICQFRIEFEDVEVANPLMGDCNNDTIMVTGFDALSAKVVPMSLCGTLSGQHMIVNVKEQTQPGAKLTVNIDTSIAQKWRMRVKQIPCDELDQLAPPGCVTYETEQAGNIVSYNNQGGSGEMINNQKFSHCIKYQDSFCDVAFTSNNFDLGAGDSITLGDNKQTGMNFGTGGMLQWNITGPPAFVMCSDADNAAMNVGYDLSYLLLPC